MQYHWSKQFNLNLILTSYSFCEYSLDLELKDLPFKILKNLNLIFLLKTKNQRTALDTLKTYQGHKVLAY